jgi:hypothetical protein
MRDFQALRERRARDRVARLGYQLKKSRGRDCRQPNYGGFMIVDPEHNWVVAGGDPFVFSLDLADVEAWLGARN